MNQTLKQKIIKIFDVYITEESDEKIIRELDRRGKLSLKALVEIMFLLVDEIESMKEDQTLAKEILKRAKEKPGTGLVKRIETLEKSVSSIGRYKSPLGSGGGTKKPQKTKTKK